MRNAPLPMNLKREPLILNNLRKARFRGSKCEKSFRRNLSPALSSIGWRRGRVFSGSLYPGRRSRTRFALGYYLSPFGAIGGRIPDLTLALSPFGGRGEVEEAGDGV